MQKLLKVDYFCTLQWKGFNHHGYTDIISGLDSTVGFKGRNEYSIEFFGGFFFLRMVRYLMTR